MVDRGDTEETSISPQIEMLIKININHNKRK